MKSARWRIAFILALFACAPVSPRAKEQSPKPDEQGRSSEPVVPVAASHDPIRTPPQTPRSDQQPNNWHEWFWPPNWSNWALLIAAGVAGRIAFRTLKAIESEVGATKLAAEATDRSAKTAERALRLLNRPWLETADWTAKPVITNVGPGGHTKLTGFRIYFNIVNHSSTPARINWVNTETRINDGEAHGVDAAVETVVTPGGSFPFVATVTFTDAHRQAFLSSGVAITLRGWLHYSDLFTPRQPASVDHVRGPRVRRFGRRMLLSQSSQQFQIPTGAEGIGMNDEDWDDEADPHST